MKLLFFVILLWGSQLLRAQSYIYVIDNQGALCKINPVDCSSQLIGNCPRPFFDIALHPVTHDLYGVYFQSLYKINPLNAESSYIGPTGNFNGLTFDANGVMYGSTATDHNLYVVNPQTGDFSSSGFIDGYYGSGGDISFFHSRLYITTTDSKLFYLDPIDSTYLLIASNSLNNAFGWGLCTYSDDCQYTLFSFSGNEMYQINIGDTPNTTLHCSNLDYLNDIYGATSSSEGIVGNTVDLGPDLYLCGDMDTLDLTPISNGSFTWQDGSTASHLSVHEPGKYWVRNNVNGCISSDTIIIQLYPSPDFNWGPDQILCPNTTIKLLGINPEIATNTWYYDYLGISQISSQYECYPWVSAKYWVDSKVHNCIFSDTIRIANSMEINFNLGPDKIICQGQEYRISLPESIQSISEFPKISYHWQDNSTDQDLLVIQPGKYWLTVIDSNCSITKTDTLGIHFKECEVELSMPNLITSNKDNQNDTFTPIKMKGISEAELLIFNRWGEQVFQSKEFPPKWDSSEVNEGVYYWTIHYMDTLGNRSSQNGWVHVMY